ncbi:TIGR03618 family F420-dependent PPOX class oxidoreductase [Actinomadura sp. ATCC 31491]|uniref:TIGR03618 family F420-dependent PPOX class oxidoreductase n=1 Tax=Actinomadura luzonensis TaxID=2805427 RepID=A0ABT0FZP3_9ACTN|nr:TIGR03618 family F420-dependent PPOX class oxidoreductase [Actinomadura luzonensis]MCK2217769.1 TIGR03618 family F420-dependent PPOX class oxidoreductase [Actinomadura luzonensis]
MPEQYRTGAHPLTEPTGPQGAGGPPGAGEAPLPPSGPHGAGAGEEPRPLTDAELSALLDRQRFGALATQQDGGRPHVSTVRYHWDPERRVVRISTVADRLKVRQLHADPRCALYVTSDDFGAYGVAEGAAELSPVTAEPGDEVGLELLAMQAGLADPAGEAAFLRRMVADRRLVIRIRASRLYGTALPAPFG